MIFGTAEIGPILTVWLGLGCERVEHFPAGVNWEYFAPRKFWGSHYLSGVDKAILQLLYQPCDYEPHQQACVRYKPRKVFCHL